MEKVSGIWGAEGPPRYAEFLQWVVNSPWIQPVKLSDWERANPARGSRKIETGTFAELAREFDAGGGYEKWFYSEHWSPYREHFERTERRVRECKREGADPALIELAEKQLLVSNWETAWHTPATGPHGHPEDHGKPSPWARALTSHCRHALVTAEAACWMNLRDGRAHGHPEDHGKPSPWARALTSHCRHALVTAEAACWMNLRDGRAHGHPEDHGKPS